MENMNSEKFDYVVIGAGCAGLASAQYAARGGLSVLVLDVAGAGRFLNLKIILECSRQ